MNKRQIFRTISVAVVGMLLSGAAEAQYFGSASAAASSAQKYQKQPDEKQQAKQQPADIQYSVVDTEEKQKETSVEKQPVSSPFDYAYGKDTRPKQAAPAQQQYRRYSTVGGVTVETTEEHEEDELIMLYMKNFRVYRSPSGQTRCSARFAVLTTLPVRLTNVSYRLKWQDIETALTFTDVEPGVENHFDYGLLGDGCYGMDKQPNIIVNRCRAKGMTQRQCASKIRWIKEI